MRLSAHPPAAPADPHPTGAAGAGAIRRSSKEEGQHREDVVGREGLGAARRARRLPLAWRGGSGPEAHAMAWRRSRASWAAAGPPESRAASGADQRVDREGPGGGADGGGSGMPLPCELRPLRLPPPPAAAARRARSPATAGARRSAAVLAPCTPTDRRPAGAQGIVGGPWVGGTHHASNHPAGHRGPGRAHVPSRPPTAGPRDSLKDGPRGAQRAAQ